MRSKGNEKFGKLAAFKTIQTIMVQGLPMQKPFVEEGKSVLHNKCGKLGEKSCSLIHLLFVLYDGKLNNLEFWILIA